MRINESISIAAVVVTYNRGELLINCLNAIMQQSLLPDEVIIIDNHSNDNTKELLFENGYIEQEKNIENEFGKCQSLIYKNTKVKITYVFKNINDGGAGGFYAGMKTAYDAGYEWIWMMDDDGKPDSNQLDELYNKSIKYDLLFSNALVCNIEDPEYLSFGLNPTGSSVITSTREAQRSEIIKSINPFNGTFINRKVIEKIGFIKREMFIWGDETEFTLRANKNGIETRTITSAIQFHPAVKGITCNVIPYWEKFKVNIKPKNLSHIFYRNLGYIYRNYRPKKYWHPILLYSIALARKLDCFELIKFYKFYRRGYKNIF